MINEVIVSRLDELIGDYDTPFINYLLYSYDISVNDCELIIDDLKGDIYDNKVLGDNLVYTLQEYFKSKIIELEKESKIEFLSELMSQESEFYVKYLAKFDLKGEDRDIIFEKLKSKILKDNITDFEIRRYLEYYFANSVKQVSYVNDLSSIVGRNYDTLIIRSAKKKYPILIDRDMVQIVSEIHGDIIDAREFKNGIKQEFLKRCMLKSEEKKALARKNLNSFVEGSGDSFSKLIRIKGLSKSDGDAIVKDIVEDISEGRIQPEWISNAFITKRFNEYVENERK